MCHFVVGCVFIFKQLTMPLVTMDAAMSSVLREANNSLMASQSWSSQKVEEHRSHEHNVPHISGQLNPNSQPTSDQPTPRGNTPILDGQQLTAIGLAKQRHGVLDFSLPSTKWDSLSAGQRERRPHSSPPDQPPDMSCPPFASHLSGDIFHSVDNFPSLYAKMSGLAAAVPSFPSPMRDDIHMDVGLPSGTYSLSRTSSPSAMDTRTFLPVDLLPETRHLDADESTLPVHVRTENYLGLGGATDFHSFYSHQYSGQGHITDLQFDSDQDPDFAYLELNGSIRDHHHDNVATWPRNNPGARSEVNMLDLHSVSNSLDSFDILTDSNSKYEDSDYSDTSNDHYTTRYPSATLHQNQHSNNSDNNQYSFKQSISKPSCTSTPSPSSSSQTANENVQTSLTDASYSQEDQHESAAECKAGKANGRGGMKLRGAQNLPPCRVCGNMASGLHFGVNTCEACNEFFRRSLKRGATYYCSKNRECQVYGKKRNACSFCRYQRCVEMGMSRDAIKTGRYSHKTRTEYAMEVEKFKMREVNRVEMEKYEVLLSDLVRYHDKYVKVTTRIPDEDLLQNQTDYIKLYHTQREHERRHPPLKAPVQNKRLLDDWTLAKEDLSLTMHDAEMTEHWLRNYINYAKNVPGFKELALSDQASLVRGSWFEFWFLGAFRGYNSSLQVVAYPNGRCFHREEINKVFGQEYTDFSFYLADRMRSLEVTPEVMVLIKTVCLTFPDRTSLDNKEAVDKMHWSMVSCLMHTLAKLQSGGCSMFPLVVSKLVELRTLTDIAMRAHKSALFQDVLKDSPLLCEMVDTKTRYVQSLQKNAAPDPGHT